MERVAVAGESGDLNAELFEDAEPRLERRRVGEKLFGIAVGLAGISAGPDLDGVHAESGEDRERFLECLVSVEVFKYAEFHFFCSLSFLSSSVIFGRDAPSRGGRQNLNMSPVFAET